MIQFLWHSVVAMLQTALGFYGFWFVWRVLLPILPGPENRSDRIAPFARYFTDPFIGWLRRYFRLNEWIAALLGLLLISSVSVGTAYLAATI